VEIAARVKRATTLSTKAIAARMHPSEQLKGGKLELSQLHAQAPAPPAWARRNWAYDQRSCQKRPKLWAGTKRARVAVWAILVYNSHGSPA